MSFGPELLVIEMMGVIGSNWRMSDVAEMPVRERERVRSRRKSGRGRRMERTYRRGWA